MKRKRLSRWGAGGRILGMAKSRDYVIAYDLTGDRERDRLSKVLEGFGVRAQKSVFECRLTKSGEATLRRKIEALELSTGFVTMYEVKDLVKRKIFGEHYSQPFDEANYAVVV